MFTIAGTRHLDFLRASLLPLTLLLASSAHAGTDEADFRFGQPPSAYLDVPLSELTPMMAWTEVRLRKLDSEDGSVDRDLAFARTKLEVHLLLLQKRHAEVLPLIERIRQQSDKPQLRNGLMLIEELLAQGQAEAWEPAQLKAAYIKRLEALPWPATAQPLRLLRHELPDPVGKEALQGVRLAWQVVVDPQAEDSSLDGSFTAAQKLINFRYGQSVLAPMKSALDAAIATELARHDAGDSFWAEREYRPPANEGHAVSVLVWEQAGVDISLFKHPRDACLAFAATPTCLVDPSIKGVDRVTAWRFVKGWQDHLAGIESAEHSDYWHYSRALFGNGSQMSTAQLTEFANFNGQLVCSVPRIHGTHVAGIATKDNPYVELVALNDEQLSAIGNDVRARRFARISTFIRVHHVRIVNMSWAIQAGMMAPDELADFEMRMNQLFALEPDTLFVAGAGNDDNSVEGRRVVPASLDAPNLLTVGAADQAGQVTNFSNTGRTVAVYANGDDVESLMPGGMTVRMSGTSMAAPQVVNLAAKLLSQRPDLSVDQLKRLILDGSDEIAAGSQTEKAMHLLNPRKSAALAGLAGS